MDFGNPHLEELLANFHSFHVEAFNIFAIGSDQLPHLICVCPNKGFALALCALLENAAKTRTLQTLDVSIISNCHLCPVLLADGNLALAVMCIDGPVYVDGKELHQHGPKLQLGTSDYRSLVVQFTDLIND